MQKARKPQTSTTTDQSDKLPTSSSPSSRSDRLGHPWYLRNWARTSVYLAVKPTPGSLQINLLFTIFAEQAQTLETRRANFFFFRRQQDLNLKRSKASQGQRPAPIGRRTVRRQHPKDACAVRTKIEAHRRCVSSDDEHGQ